MRQPSILPVIAAIVFAAGPVRAQESVPFQTTGAFFAASVPDLALASRWYVEKLGMRVTMPPQQHGRVSVTVLEGGGLIVELLQDQDATARTAGAGPSRLHGIMKAGIVVADFDSAVAQLRARGVEFVAGPFPAREGQRANLLIRDGAGNLLQLFAR